MLRLVVLDDTDLNPLPDSSKLKEFADDNFKFDENGRKLTKRVENTVGKGEIAHYEQFLLFPQCFQRACFPGASKGVIVWELVNSFLKKTLVFTCLRYKSFENTVGKGEIANNEQFLLFPQCFLPMLGSFCHCHQV